MNPQVKARWIEALRSGNYSQGLSCLRRLDDTYCCLGVLCDLYLKEVGRPWEENLSFGEDFKPEKRYTCLKQRAFLSPEVRAWSGLTYSEEGRLSHLNDLDQLPFPQIADYLERLI